MSPFHAILPPELAVARATIASKKALFARLAELGGHAANRPASAVGEALWLRERLGPTGFGGGTAIPHARMDGLTGFHMGVVSLAEAMPYDAVDGAPVDLVVMLLSPTDGGAHHLKLLALISRTLRDSDIVAKLRGASTDAALHSLLVPPDARAA